MVGGLGVGQVLDDGVVIHGIVPAHQVGSSVDVAAVGLGDGVARGGSSFQLMVLFIMIRSFFSYSNFYEITIVS